jgi:hypothetical protein
VVVADRGGDDAGRAAVVADLVVAEHAPLDLDVLAALVAIALVAGAGGGERAGSTSPLSPAAALLDGTRGGAAGASLRSVAYVSSLPRIIACRGNPAHVTVRRQSAAMAECWASSLGSCGGGPSREHLISKSQFSTDKVTVKGFTWCPDAKTIGIGSLVAKNLCRDHNMQLSPADAEASRLLQGLIQINQRTEAWKRGERRPRIVLQFEAARIEQWLLKTTFNLALQGGSAHAGLFVEGHPDERLVRIAFGLEEFPEPEGLYWIVALGGKIEGSEVGSIEWESLVRPEDRAVVGARFQFHGHRIWLALPGAPRRADVSRGTQIGFVETSCEIQLNWSKRRIRERRRMGG